MKSKLDVTNSVRQTISDFAWDATVGCGNDADPTIQDVRRLEQKLGHELTHDEAKLLQLKWLEALQSMAQP